MPLIINDLNVEYLSGFTDIYLLTPKYINLPIILNLGEIHEDIKYPCDDPNSMDIPKLLEQLNILASTFHVEIYSEDFMNYKLLSLAKDKDTTLDKWDQAITELEKDEDHINHFGALGLFNDNKKTLSCYYKDLKLNNIDIFNAKCEYPNIIWQYSDARKTFRSHITNSVYSIENVTDAFANIERAISKFALINDEYYKNYPKYLNAPEKMDTIEKKYVYVNKIINDIFKKTMYEHSLDLPTIIELLQLIIDFHELPDKAADTIINVPIIMKQLKKQVGFKPDEIKFKHHIKSYINYILGEFKGDDKILLCYIEFMKAFIIYLQNNTIQHFPLFMAKINLMISCKPLRRNIYNIDNIPLQLITAPGSIILDIYFVLRILKNPRKDLVCNLSGAAHTRHISHFLTEILGFYEKTEFLNNDPLNDEDQCIRFTKEININDLLLHNQQIESKQYEHCDPKEKSCCNRLTGICRNVFNLGGKTRKGKNQKRQKKNKRKTNKFKKRV